MVVVGNEAKPFVTSVQDAGHSSDGVSSQETLASTEAAGPLLRDGGVIRARRFRN